jgi:predicted nucleic acid-binding Zn ribbon protein
LPLYSYKHPTTGEIREVIQGMNETHDFYDEAGVKWDRVFSKPNAVIDANGNANPFSEKEFVKVTANKKGETIGDAWDRSTELSEKRKDKLGVKVDPVKQKYYENWSKRRKGKRHPKSYELES